MILLFLFVAVFISGFMCICDKVESRLFVFMWVVLLTIGLTNLWFIWSELILYGAHSA